MKDIKCKCSHLKSEHKKTFWGIKYCNNCQCEEYLRFNAPTKWDKVSFIYGIIMTGIVLFVFISMGYAFSFIPQEELNEPIEITLGDFMALVMIIVALIVWIILTIIVDNHVLDYLRIRKRRTF